jgi:hypothetical protein
MDARATLVALLFVVAAAGGCKSDPPGAVAGGNGMLASASTDSVDADYDDIDAAVGVAAGKNEMAVVWANGVTDSPRRFYLRTVRDEPVYLFIGRQPSFDRPPARDPKAPDPGEHLLMRCTVGRFGDERREEDLLDAVRKRLDELHGKDWAPRK